MALSPLEAAAGQPGGALMLERLRAWWRARSTPERVLLAGGVPAVAIAALINRRRDEAAAAADAEGGEGSAAVLPGNVPEVIHAGALGVDTGQLAQYLESFTDEIGRIESRLDQFENDLMDFGQPPAQPQKPAQPEPKPQPQPKPQESKPKAKSWEHLRAAVLATGHNPKTRIDEIDVRAALFRIGHNPKIRIDPIDEAALLNWYAQKLAGKV